MEVSDIALFLPWRKKDKNKFPERTTKMDFEELMKRIGERRDDLKSRINSFFVECNDIKSEIEKKIKAKGDAKKEYEDALDRGLEDKMSSALKTIRESNSTVESYKGQLLDFPTKISELRAEQQAISAEARALRQPAEKAMTEAKQNYEKVSAFIDTCTYNILSDLNQLSNEIDRH